MGTRNLTMVISNGKTKVAQYGQWDGYPSGQGSTALETLKRIINSGQLGQFKAKIDTIQWITEDGAERIEKDSNWEINYPYLSRDCGAQILSAIHFGEMTVPNGIGKERNVKVEVIGLINDEAFAADSLFCEWAYVIDLDKGTFEVYEGFNKTPLTEGERFYVMQSDNLHFEERRGTDQYFPVKLVKEYQLTDLPKTTDFINECVPEEAEEENN